MMTKPNYNMTLLFVLLGLAPACDIGDKNLGESGGESDDETTDPGDTDSGDTDLPGDMPNEEPTTCGNGTAEPGELCFELIQLPISGALDVAVEEADGSGENSIADLVVLTNDPEAPLLIWHNDPEVWERFEPEPEIVAGSLPTPTIPGLEIGDFDPNAIEYLDIAYATAEGVVIGWDKGIGVDDGFDELTLVLPCANPMSFTLGNFDLEHNGADVLCAHEAEGGGIEVLLASNSGARSFAGPLPLGSDLLALTPLHAAGEGQFIAHDRVDELIVWQLADDEYLSFSYPVPALAWDFARTFIPNGPDLVIASHDPQGLLMIDETPEGEYEAGELLATESAPWGVTSFDVTQDLQRDLLVTLGSGQLGVWPATDAGLGEAVFFEVGAEPREIGVGKLGWTESVAIAVTTSDGVSLLYPDP